MKSEAGKILELFDDTKTDGMIDLYEMANYGEKWTGLPVMVFASPKEHSTGPRIKISKNSSSFRNKRGNFSVSISDYPEVVAGSYEGIVDKETLKKIFKWVILNKEALLKFWNGEIDTGDLTIALKKV